MDYISAEREQQLALLRASLLEHCRRHPESLIVVEEYDKLDCSTRGFLRQLIENAQTGNVSLDRQVGFAETVISMAPIQLDCHDICVLWLLLADHAAPSRRSIESAIPLNCWGLGGSRFCMLCIWDCMTSHQHADVTVLNAGRSSCWSQTAGTCSCTSCCPQRDKGRRYISHLQTATLSLRVLSCMQYSMPCTSDDECCAMWHPQ